MATTPTATTPTADAGSDWRKLALMSDESPERSAISSSDSQHSLNGPPGSPDSRAEAQAAGEDWARMEEDETETENENENETENEEGRDGADSGSNVPSSSGWASSHATTKDAQGSTLEIQVAQDAVAPEGERARTGDGNRLSGQRGESEGASSPHAGIEGEGEGEGELAQNVAPGGGEPSGTRGGTRPSGEGGAGDSQEAGDGNGDERERSTSSPPGSEQSSRNCSEGGEVGPDEKRSLLVLISVGVVDRIQASNQRRALSMLEFQRIPHETVDGAEVEQRELRNDLFEVAGISSVSYPQFFFVGDGTLSYFGDFTKLEQINEASSLDESILSSQPEIETWDRVFRNIVHPSDIAPATN